MTCFGENAEVALDLLELLESAWHDCYGEASPPEDIIDDIWVLSRGQLPDLVRAVRLALEDTRDLRMSVHSIRNSPT